MILSEPNDWSDWGIWSKCSYGLKERIRICKGPTADLCSPKLEYDRKKCNDDQGKNHNFVNVKKWIDAFPKNFARNCEFHTSHKALISLTHLSADSVLSRTRIAIHL